MKTLRLKCEYLFRVERERSQALPQQHYGDPAKVVVFERETCKGCEFERIIPTDARIPIGVCVKKNKDGSKRRYGRRCKEYRIFVFHG